VALVRERTIPTERPPLVGEVNADVCRYRGCRAVSEADPYGRNFDFLDRSRYFFFQVVPQFYSWGWVDSVTDQLLLRKSGSAGQRTLTIRSQRRSCVFFSSSAYTWQHTEKWLRYYCNVNTLWLTLQTGRSRVRLPMRWFFFLNSPNPSDRTRPWGLLRLLHKWVL
jgi:hypothetical protein